MTAPAAAGLTDLVGRRPEVELLGAGFRFVEGPVWHPLRRELLFNDIPGDARWRWTAADGPALATEPTRRANGMTYDADLNLLVCEHSTSSLVSFDSRGRRTVLVSRFEGAELNSPNDVVVAPDGSALFTDPIYGRSQEFGIQRPLPMDIRGLYRLTPERRLELLVDDFDQPNGLCISPDGARLYVNDSPRAHIRVFELGEDGLGSGAIFAERIGTGVFGEGIVDGMKCDALGNVWVTGPGGIWVIDADGRPLGVVPVPEEVGNLHWGGADWSWMFVCASTKLYRFRTRVSGSLEPFMKAATA